MEAVGPGRNALASGTDPFCLRHHRGDALTFTASVCLRGRGPHRAPAPALVKSGWVGESRHSTSQPSAPQG